MSISGKVDPVVRPVAATDIAEALVEGLRDFQALPLYGLCFGALYAGGGIAIMLCLTAFGMVYLVYPLAAGFALIGPFVAIGLTRSAAAASAASRSPSAPIWSGDTRAQRDRLDGLRHAVRVRDLDVPGAAAHRAAARPARLVLELCRNS
jgi:hypothetical protein